jgi:hypothetical protein
MMSQSTEQTEKQEKQHNQKPECVVCSARTEEGIFIFDHFICRPCEAEMVETDVDEQKYAYFIARMRKLWQAEQKQH